MENLNNNQNNQNTWGGKREGAGRKEGSKKKPVISDFITEEEIKNLVKLAKKQAKIKSELLKFLLEQVFGKAPYTIRGDDENPFITIIKYANGNTITPPISAEKLPDSSMGSV